MNALSPISQVGGLTRACRTLIYSAVVMLACLHPGEIWAGDSKGVHYVTIKVTAPLGEPLKGVTAVVSVPPQPGEEEFFAMLGIAKQVGSWSALQKRGFATDVFGVVSVPYITGESTYDQTLHGVAIFLPHEIVISAKGYVTKRLKFKERSFFRSNLQLPFFDIVLTPLKKDEAPREEEREFWIKQVPIPKK